MSWGIRITILYLSFVGLIVSMVTMSMSQKVDLVTKNYYEEEIKYQDRINTINRTQLLDRPLTWEVSGRTIILKFPDEIKGSQNQASVYFFRPSDARMDKTIQMPADTILTRTITVNELQRGVYKMQVSWKSGAEEYYNEGIIRIN